MAEARRADLSINKDFSKRLDYQHDHRYACGNRSRFAQPLPGNTGWTWTLASRLGHILRTAIELFGPRDSSYTILGVEFGGDVPQIWYLGNCNNVIVQITPSCATDFSRACYQMAHEAVHLLCPTGGSGANNFEEGIATYYSQHYMRVFFNQPNWDPVLESYRRAVNLIAPHLNARPDALRRMRELQSNISLITEEMIRSEFQGLTDDDVRFLVEPFSREAL